MFIRLTEMDHFGNDWKPVAGAKIWVRISNLGTIWEQDGYSSVGWISDGRQVFDVMESAEEILKLIKEAAEGES